MILSRKKPSVVRQPVQITNHEVHLWYAKPVCLGRVTRSDSLHAWVTDDGKKHASTRKAIDYLALRYERGEIGAWAPPAPARVSKAKTRLEKARAAKEAAIAEAEARYEALVSASEEEAEAAGEVAMPAVAVGRRRSVPAPAPASGGSTAIMVGKHQLVVPGPSSKQAAPVKPSTPEPIDLSQAELHQILARLAVLETEANLRAHLSQPSLSSGGVGDSGVSVEEGEAMHGMLTDAQPSKASVS